MSLSAIVAIDPSIASTSQRPHSFTKPFQELDIDTDQTGRATIWKLRHRDHAPQVTASSGSCLIAWTAMRCSPWMASSP